MDAHGAAYDDLHSYIPARAETAMDEKLLTRSSTAVGLTCMVIGVAHAVTGLRKLPGSPRGDASLDSQERFFGPVFAAYGLLWTRGAVTS